MSWWSRAREQWRPSARRSRFGEMDEEMRQHVELEAEELVRRGVAADEARRRALVAFGSRERYREEGWEARRPR